MQGKFIHVAPTEPRSDWNCGFDLPWWQNADEYRIGRLTSSTCLIRIMNMLTESEDFLEVGAYVHLRHDTPISAICTSGHQNHGELEMLLRISACMPWQASK